MGEAPMFISEKVERPKKKLCAFTREMIKKGEKKTIQLHIDTETLSYWDDAVHAFVLENTTTPLTIPYWEGNQEKSLVIE